MNPKVSIITVCYNAETTIEQTIQSVLGQTYSNVEYIIVDGQSTDCTMEIVNRYRDKIAKVVSEPDNGIYDAMNKGIRTAAGEVIGIVNADDWLETDAVESVVNCFRDNDADIVHGDIRYVWENGLTQGAPKTETLDKLWHSMVVRHPATFVRKEVYETYGLFDSSYRIAGDYEFILRCYANGVRFCYLDKILSNFRTDGVSNARGRECAKETHQVSMTYIDEAPNKEEVYKMILGNIDNETFLEVFEEQPRKVLDMIKETIPKIQSGVMIRGIGVWGHRYLKLMQKCNVPVRYFVDNDKTKIGTCVEDIPIISPEEATEKSFPILVAIKTADEQLLQSVKSEYCLHENIKEEVLLRYKKKTILYFFDYGAAFGGAANTLLQQALLAKNAGYEVLALVSGYEGNTVSEEYREKFEMHGIEWQSLNFVLCSHTEDIDIVGVFECYEKVRRKVFRYRPIALHSIQINPTVELVSRELGIPHIMNIYQAVPDFFALPYTDIFPKYHICDSECFAKAWEEGLQTQSVCIRTVVNDFTPRKCVKNKEKLNFICVGQVTSRKNQLEVIRGFQSALERGVKGTLYIYGYDKEHYAKECAEYITKHALEKRVCIEGFVTSMKEAYEKADVLICGSKVESYPNVVSEALANGVIVISSPVAGVPEIIRDGENGYLCEGYEAKDFAKKIVECYQAFKTEKIEVVLKKANQTFDEVHSAEKAKRRLVAFYEDIIERRIGKRFLEPEKIRKMFCDVTEQYRVHKNAFLFPQLVKTKLWYVYHMRIVLREMIQGGRKVYIWGTGKMGTHTLQMMKVFCPDITIEGFIDSYKEGCYEKYPILKPERIIYEKDSVVLVALINGQEEVIRRLRQANKIYGQDYFQLMIRAW